MCGSPRVFLLPVVGRGRDCSGSAEWPRQPLPALLSTGGLCRAQRGHLALPVLGSPRTWARGPRQVFLGGAGGGGPAFALVQLSSCPDGPSHQRGQKANPTARSCRELDGSILKCWGWRTNVVSLQAVPRGQEPSERIWGVLRGAAPTETPRRLSPGLGRSGPHSAARWSADCMCGTLTVTSLGVSSALPKPLGLSVS